MANSDFPKEKLAKDNLPNIAHADKSDSKLELNYK